ncbi:MAG TPA: arylsulfatase [Tepidisphaeraceae bacterium]|jgi:arylsulfatase|nr:arylsulfatase [Tepidisphaeraceae bacterium]
MKPTTFLLTLFLLLASTFTHAADNKRPNIVILLADDMGFSDVGCYGSEIPTPNIDSLAADGLRFTQFYNTCRCCPSRACLLTGLYSHEAGVGHMVDPTPEPGYRGELSHDARTIAEVLHTAGYETYMSGKWHVTAHAGPNGPKTNWPLARGFDRYYGTVMGGGDYFDPAMLTRDNTPISPNSDPEFKLPEPFYYTTAVAENAAHFVRDHKSFAGEGKPFFMYVAFTAPHWPLMAPADAIAKFKGKYDAGYTPIRQARLKRQIDLGIIDPKWTLSDQAGDWSTVPDKAWEARCMEVYAAQVNLLDQGVGTVIASLKETGQLDNTLVIFLSDNGACAEATGREPTHPTASKTPPAEGQPQMAIRPAVTRAGHPILDGPSVLPGPEESFIAYGRSWANVSDTPFREYKHWVHEGGISTPFVVHWPAAISRHGELERQPGHLIDLMPTCIAAAGATYPSTAPPLEGISLLPAFQGSPLDRKNPLFWEHEGNRAVRDGNWKLVAKGIKGPWELYDMLADRTELHDLASEHPDQVKQLAAEWQSWAERAQVLPMMPYNKRKKPVASSD